MLKPEPIVDRRPGRAGYLLAFFIFLSGIVVMVSFLWPRLNSIGDQLTQVVVPGSQNLTLDKAGTYTIFHEHTSVVDGTAFVSSDISGLRVAVEGANGAGAIDVRAPEMSANYAIGGRSGTALFTFDITQPGIYRLTARYDDERDAPRAILAVGHGFMGKLFGTIFGALAIVIVSGVIAFLVAMFTWRARRR